MNNDMVKTALTAEIITRVIQLFFISLVRKTTANVIKIIVIPVNCRLVIWYLRIRSTIIIHGIVSVLTKLKVLLSVFMIATIETYNSNISKIALVMNVGNECGSKVNAFLLMRPIIKKNIAYRNTSKNAMVYGHSS